MKIDDKNKLIGKFMGEVHEDKMQYNLSWESLMPVVEKIDKTEWENHDDNEKRLSTWNVKPFEVIIGTDTHITVDNDVDAEKYNSEYVFSTHRKGNRFENTFNAVFEFVDWYFKNV